VTLSRPIPALATDGVCGERAAAVSADFDRPRVRDSALPQDVAAAGSLADTSDRYEHLQPVIDSLPTDLTEEQHAKVVQLLRKNCRRIFAYAYKYRSDGCINAFY